MTAEEMERGIEFLLKSQANFEAQLAKSQANFEAQLANFEAQLAKTSSYIETLAKTQTEFTQFVRSNLEAQNELNQSLRETVRALTRAQARADERLNDLEDRDGKH